MTSHIQPLDAGLIRAFKSHYQKRFLNRTIQLFSEGKRGKDIIYKIDIHTSMNMCKCAWENVSEDTIKNCWGHTKIVKFNDDVEM